jgi:hypothetical protein
LCAEITCLELSTSPFHLFFLLFVEAKGAMEVDRVLQSFKLQVLLARASKYIEEKVQMLEIEEQ